MKFIAQIIITGILVFLGQYILPWWGVFIAAFLGGLIFRIKGFPSFIAGFLAVFILWFTQIYLLDAANESLLSEKVSAIFKLSSPFMLMIVSSLIGGLAGGFSALTGKLFGSLFKKKKEVYSVYT